MIRWLIGFLLAWGICLVGVFIAWLIGVSIQCVFISGCLARLDVHSLFAAVNGRGVFARGTFLAVAITSIVWFRRRSR